VEDHLFNAERHVHPHRLNQGDAAAVAAWAAELMAQPLNLSRPLWQLHVVTGLADGRFALLVKVHHALADGMRAAELGIALLDGFARSAPAASAAVDAPISLGGMARDLRSAAQAATGLARRPDQLVKYLGNVPAVARESRRSPGSLDRCSPPPG